ncbi:galactose oxidase [Dyadobacter sandarakinus]|uniref:Galactose oxidase n=1 Tax=Dyadobacter sandarakinus TaxID=2747268 RepID=A0ABX7I5Q5_9BACT|nr:galactose oxidase [Dyadobacter sandarakinus]QRR01426.1 galactose oxidase [Dyadobacter sandarakinus]
MLSRLLLFIFLLISSLSGCTRVWAQSYGLGFRSFEVVQDKRTALDLSPGTTLCPGNNFEIAFDLAFLPDQKNYFGYILRLIGDNNRNVDILYDNSDTASQRFKVVTGDRFSSIAFDITGAQLYEWNRLRLFFDQKKQQIVLHAGNKTFTHPYQVSDKTCYKILFGAAQYKNFHTTDVPPMKVRDVQISQDGKVKYQWPLDEMAGAEAAETIRHANAQTSNPVWIKKMHHSWQPLQNFTITGPARVTGDPATGSVYVVGQDSLYSYRIATGQLSVKAYARQSLFMDNQVLFEKSSGRIYNLFINEKSVSELDLTSGAWNQNVTQPALKTHFLHANKFFSPADSSIYILGGYGHLEYKGNIQKYDLRSGAWMDLSRRDTLFTPRYLASLGVATGGAYVIGGYGSTTGRQVLNPRNLYDLLFYNVKDNTFKRIYELKVPGEDFVFANSMVVNEKDSTFYALIFPKDKFATQLQLIRGSLVKPEIRRVGSPIQYQFVDTKSFADLFFDAHSNRFVAVTQFTNEHGQTNVAIHSLYAPPLDTEVRTQDPGMHTRVMLTLILVAILIMLGAIAAWRVWGMMRRTDRNVAQPDPVVLAEPESELAAELIAVPDTAPRHFPATNSITLFGNFQIFDEQGNEITKSFTPLLKELFLVLLLHSLRRPGISSEKLKELLWFDKNPESARNNRSVNIAKLKSILDKLHHCQVSKETGYWRIDIDEKHIHVDYAHYLDLVSGKELTKENIAQLADITKRGSFLSNQNYEWLDPFKSEVSNEIVDTYLRYAGSVKVADDPEFLVRLANYIFYFDPVNEEAMTLKCKALAHLGKHSLAKSTYENFAREYSRIYAEEFRKDMPEVMHS